MTSCDIFFVLFTWHDSDVGAGIAGTSHCAQLLQGHPNLDLHICMEYLLMNPSPQHFLKSVKCTSEMLHSLVWVILQLKSENLILKN